MIMSITATRILLTAILLISCNDWGEIVVPARIIPGVSVEGIRLGQLKEQVEERLGSGSGPGGADGFRKSWYTYSYTSGVANGVRVFYLDSIFFQARTAPGPVDMIEMRTPYDGLTAEHVGLGSLTSHVRKAYGIPSFSLVDNGVVTREHYCFTGVEFIFWYNNDTVSMMRMQPFIRTIADTLCL
jgi:hypothetical protein